MNAGRHLKTGQCIHGLVSRGQDIDESLVGPLLELLTAVLVLVDRTKDGDNLLLWTDMPDDRESNFSGAGNRGAYPTVRRFNMGIDLNF